MSGGTRPNSFGQLLLDRGLRLAAGLAVVVAIPVAVLFYFQSRSLRLEATSAVVLRQLSSDTAESRKTVEEALKRPHISVLLGVPQARMEPPDTEFIAPVLTDSFTESPFIDEYYVVVRAVGQRPRRALAGVRSRQWRAERAGARPVPRGTEVGDRLLPKFQQMSSLRRAIVAFPETIDGRPHYIQAQLRWASPARDRLTSLMAFAVDAERLRQEFFPSLVAARVALLQQPTGFPPLRVTLPTTSDASSWRATARASSRWTNERSPRVLRQGAAGVRRALRGASRDVAAAYELRPATIPEIVSANTRPQLALMLLVAAVMGVGVFLVAGAAAREVRSPS